jgi:glutathione S-transferase
MILYYAPGACSLADHIALHEANLTFQRMKVDLKTRVTEGGRDYTHVNPKGYVPALEFGNGYVLTENIAILAWIADQASQLSPVGELGRYRLLETLAFITSEIHKAFKPFFAPGSTDAEKTKAGGAIGGRLDLIASQLEGPWLFGPELSVADPYLYVMLTWARRNQLRVPDSLSAFFDRMSARPAVQLALEHEGLH